MAGLVGRAVEDQSLTAYLDTVAAEGGPLVVSGEAGVGKTVLLDAAAAEAHRRGFRVLRAGGVEFEADIGYASLNQLLIDHYAAVEALGTPHREVVELALGQRSGLPRERILTCNAFLALIRSLGATAPTILVVDDFQWVDRSSGLILGFVARRLAGTRVGVLVARRDGLSTPLDRIGSPGIEVSALGAADAATLFARHFPAAAPRVARQLLSQAAGNPLAILELPAALSPAQLAAQSPLPESLPLGERLQRVFTARIAPLAEMTRQLLLIAALEGAGDLGRILAGGRSGLDDLAAGLDDLAAAEYAQLIRVDDRRASVEFVHPLIRAAVVSLSTRADRRRAHAALAAVAGDQPERRAWHLASAADGPDERVADLLAGIGQQRLDRADAAGAVEALTRAADLSPDPRVRAERLTEAAYYATVSGEYHDVELLLDNAGQVTPEVRRSAPAVHARVFMLVNGDGDIPTAHRLLIRGIHEGTHQWQAGNRQLVDALHTAVLLCLWAGREDLWRSFGETLRKVRPQPPEVLDLIHDTVAAPVRAAAGRRDDVDQLLAGLDTEPDQTRIMRIGIAMMFLDRWEDLYEPSMRFIRQGRASGMTRRQLGSLNHVALGDFFTGNWDETVDIADEALAVCAESGFGFFTWWYRYEKGLVRAARGESAEALMLAGQVSEWARDHGADAAVLAAQHLRVLDAVSRNDHNAAYELATAAGPPGTIPAFSPFVLWIAFDLIEAAVRVGRLEDARAHTEALAEAAGISERLSFQAAVARALVADDAAAAALFEDALARPTAPRWPFDQARAQLCFGEWLRRDRRPIEARAPLAAAAATFDRLGARPWQQRAHSELKAAGAGVVRLSGIAVEELTARELEIADLAAKGYSNKEIGQRLMLSSRTVGAHLYRIFPKLGVTSRAALRDALTRTD